MFNYEGKLKFGLNYRDFQETEGSTNQDSSVQPVFTAVKPGICFAV